MKELKLKIEKFERAIIVQTLKVTDCVDSEHVKFSASPIILEDKIVLNKYKDNSTLGIAYFNSNEQRDIVFDKLIKWVTDEQFSRPPTKLEIGEEALFSDTIGEDGVRGTLVYILPEEFESRYLSASDSYPYWCYWKYARPANNTLKVKGNIYHWRGDNE